MPHPKVTKSSDRYQPYDLGRRPLHSPEGNARGRVVRDVPTNGIHLSQYNIRVTDQNATKQALIRLDESDLTAPLNLSVGCNGVNYQTSRGILGIDIRAVCDTSNPSVVRRKCFQVYDPQTGEIRLNNTADLARVEASLANFESNAQFGKDYRLIEYDCDNGYRGTSPEFTTEQFLAICQAYNQSRTAPKQAPTTQASTNAPTTATTQTPIATFTVYDSCTGKLVKSTSIPIDAQLRVLAGYNSTGAPCQFACDPNGGITAYPSKITNPNDGTQSYFIAGNTGDATEDHLFWTTFTRDGCGSSNQNNNETIYRSPANLQLLCDNFRGNPNKVVRPDGLCQPPTLAPLPAQNASDAIPSPSVVPVLDANVALTNYGYLALLGLVPVGGTIALGAVLTYWAYKRCYPDQDDQVKTNEVVVPEAWIAPQENLYDNVTNV